jgi:hypothetical protein
MRQLWIISTILLLSGLAAAQVTVVSGYAGDWRVPPGAYSTPFVPLVSTPSVSLNSPPSPSSVFAQPVWQSSAPAVEIEVPTTATTTTGPAQSQPGFRFGAARFQSSYGAAALAGGSHRNNQACKLYTNQDIPQPSVPVGTVKFGDKTEHLQ